MALLHTLAKKLKSRELDDFFSHIHIFSIPFLTIFYRLIFGFLNRENRNEFAYTRLRTWCSRQLARQWEENARLKSIRGRSGSLCKKKKARKNRGWKRRFTSGRWKYDKAPALDHAVPHFDWMRPCEAQGRHRRGSFHSRWSREFACRSANRGLQPAKITTREGKGERETRVTERQVTRDSVPTDKRHFSLIKEKFAMGTRRRVIGDSYWYLMIDARMKLVMGLNRNRCALQWIKNRLERDLRGLLSYQTCRSLTKISV